MSAAGAVRGAPLGGEERGPWRPGALAGGTWPAALGVDSVQWVDLPGCPPLRLATLEREYFAWVPRISAGQVSATAEPDGSLWLGAPRLPWAPLLRLAPPTDDALGRRRAIQGGLLGRPGGSIAFELRPWPKGTRLVVAVRGLSPRLPRRLYFGLQRRLHERSTYAFLRAVAARHGLRAARLALRPERPMV